MASLTPNFTSSSSSRSAAVEAWISRVSSHPFPLDPAMSDSMPVSSDEDAPAPKPQTVIPGVERPRKRARANSSPIAPPLRLYLEESSVPSSPTSSRHHTPAEIETETASAMSETSSIASGALKPDRRINTRLKREQAEPKAELARSIEAIRTSTSPYYKKFEPPYIKPNEHGVITHQYFKCKHCGTTVKRKVGVAETAALSGHSRKCGPTIKQAQLLDEFGVTGGNSATLSKTQVRERFALWTAESARPFSIVKDRYLLQLLHPDALTHRPHRDTISQDVQRIYKAAQKDLKATLLGHKGAYHIALDLFQSGNGFDFLGIVVFHYDTESPAPSAKQTPQTIAVKRFVLECLSYSDAHTGVELAKVLHTVLVKFEIADRVWGVVSDNASNNGAMMRELGTYRMKRLDGISARVHCVLHVLNLVAQAVAAPFRARRRELAKELGTGDSDDEEERVDVEVVIEDDEVDPDDDGLDASTMLDLDGDKSDPEEDDVDVEIRVPKMDKGSAEELEQGRVAKVLFKVSRLAHRLRFTPRARIIFKAKCVAKGLPTPHNIGRDCKTRWNSSKDMLTDARRTWDGAVEFQSSTRYTSRGLLLLKEDKQAVDGLLSVLKPLSTVTDILSRAGVPMLANVIVYYDILNSEYSKMCGDTKLPLYLRHAANRARVVLNKYYQKTDESELYRLAMLLHPSMRAYYLKQAEWEKTWVEAAIEIAEKCWTTHYKTVASEPVAAPEMSQFSYSKGYLGKMFANIGAVIPNSTCPVRAFVEADPLLKYNAAGDPLLLDPLVWWYSQRQAGNKFSGLTQMALDVLSTPASSVDVERAFSFAGSIVSKRRHNLSPATIQATASLGSYSKAGLVKPGILKLPALGRPATAAEKAEAAALGA